MPSKSVLRVPALAAALVFAFAGLVGCAFGAGGESVSSPPASSGGGASGPSVSTGTEVPEDGVPEGWYVLEKKTVAGKDVTADFIYNCIRLDDGKASVCEIDLSGKTVKEGTYTIGESAVNILIGVKTYDYAFDKAAIAIEYEGKVSRQEVTMRYVFDKDFSLPEAEGGVSFFEELFGESKDENFYNYCPSIMTEGNDTMHVWYCSNKDSGKIVDYVAYRKGTLNAAGKWEFGEKKLVLSPTKDTWDYVHTCDPSVVKGDFKMNGERYSYLMAYLGCATYDCTANEVGIAVAKAPEGPWVKVDSLNPIADFVHSEEYNETSWGYGQPSLVSAGNGGKVLLFYTKGVKSGTFTYVEEWDLSDLGNAEKLRESRVWDSGVANASGGADVINNADFAYDPYRRRLYCVKEDFPYPTDGGVNWITGSNTLLYMELGEGEDPFGALFGEYRWNVCGKLTRDTTGAFRNHNAGLVTDEYGRIVNPFKIPVVYTVSAAAEDYPDWALGGQWPALHTYRLHGAVFEIK